MPLVVEPASTTAAITEFQYQLETDLGEGAVRFGRGTNLLVQQFDSGTVGMRTQDSDRERENGIFMGEDWLSSRVLTWEGLSWVRYVAGRSRQDMIDSTHHMAEVLEDAWSREDIRMYGRHAVLRYNRGRGTRRVYGRPRNFVGNHEGRMHAGKLPFTADFMCMDAQSYDDVVSEFTMNAESTELSGLKEPLLEPLTAGDAQANSSAVSIGGNGYVWPEITFKGPISNPECRIIGAFNVRLNYSIAADEQVTISPAPWNRGVVSSRRGYLNGKLSAASPRLSKMRLRRGQYIIDFGGVSQTNTAQLVLRWRNGHSSI